MFVTIAMYANAIVVSRHTSEANAVVAR